jgi:hypothetical protein
MWEVFYLFVLAAGFCLVVYWLIYWLTRGGRK